MIAEVGRTYIVKVTKNNKVKHIVSKCLGKAGKNKVTFLAVNNDHGYRYPSDTASYTMRAVESYYKDIPYTDPFFSSVLFFTEPESNIIECLENTLELMIEELEKEIK